MADNFQSQPHQPVQYGLFPGQQLAYPLPYQQPGVRVVYVERPPLYRGQYPEDSSSEASQQQTQYQPAQKVQSQPKEPEANCTLGEEKEEGEICAPGDLETECEEVELKYMKVNTIEQCYTVTKTICEEQVSDEEREICKWQFKYSETQGLAKGVDVSFDQTTETVETEVCETQRPTYGGYGGYGSQQEEVCQPAEQQIKIFTPRSTPRESSVRITLPEPVKTCITKRVSVPQINCRDETEEKCTMAPEIEDAVETVEVCRSTLGPEECRDAKLLLPVQTCTEPIQEKSKLHQHKRQINPESS